MQRIRRLWALLLALMLLPCAALGEAKLLPQVEEWPIDTSPVQVKMGVQAVSVAEYDENRLAQFNALLKHLSLTLAYQETALEQWGRVAIAVDGADALSLTINESGNKAQAQLSCVPDTTYVSASGQDAAVWLLGGEAADETLSLYGLTSPWLNDGYAMLDALPNVLPDYTKERSVNTTVSKMGKAVLQQSITIEADQVAILPETLASLCTAEETTAVMKAAVFSGKQTIKLWRNDAGALIKATWTGQCGADAENLRKINLTWTLRRDDDNTRDDISLKTPAVKGNNYNTITFKRTAQTDEAGTVTLTASYTHKHRDGDDVATETGEAELSALRVSGGTQLTGEIARSIKPMNEDPTWLVLKPDLTISDHEIGMTGTLNVESRDDTRVLSSYLLTLDMTTGTYFDWLLMPKTVDMDAQGDSGAAAAREAISTAVATALIRPLVLLPYEDTLFLSADLDESAWQTVVEAARQTIR